MTPLRNFRNSESYSHKLESYYYLLAQNKRAMGPAERKWRRELDRIFTLSTPFREQAFVSSIVK